MEQSIYKLFDKYLNIKLINIIISNSAKPEEIRKVTLRLLMMKDRLCYQITEYRKNQVFHKNLSREEVLLMLPEWFEGLFKQVQLSAQDSEAVILISRKGKVTVKEKAKKDIDNTHVPPEGQSLNQKYEMKLHTNVLPHNRKKNYIIDEGCVVPFMIDLGVMTNEGKIIKSKYDKFRQINRFLEFIEDIVDLLPKGREIHILDFGCGKSYLTFAMYYYLKDIRGYDVGITGLDLKEEVIRNCNSIKERYGYDRLNFLCGDIASYEGTGRVDMVVSLHACDTAADHALYKAVEWGASVILSVPCCQHEVNKHMSSEIVKPLMKHGLIKEKMSALITDAIRAECLELKGYKTQVMEFIEMEHTPKNILIRAVKSNSIIPPKVLAEKRKVLKECAAGMGIHQKLMELFNIYTD